MKKYASTQKRYPTNDITDDISDDIWTYLPYIIYKEVTYTNNCFNVM